VPPIPVKVPHQGQTVLRPREEVAAVVSEAEAREVLVVPVQDGQEVPVGDLEPGKGQRSVKNGARSCPEHGSALPSMAAARLRLQLRAQPGVAVPGASRAARPHAVQPCGTRGGKGRSCRPREPFGTSPTATDTAKVQPVQPQTLKAEGKYSRIQSEEVLQR